MNNTIIGSNTMNMTRQKELLLAILALLLVVVPVSLFAQTASATSTVNYPGGGVIQAGDAWESFLPMRSGGAG